MHSFSGHHRLLLLSSVALGILNCARVAQGYPASSSAATAIEPVLVTFGSNASISTQPTLSNQFDDLSINSVGDLLPDRFTTEQIALAFIAALADLALEDFDGPLAFLDFTDPYRPANPVRLTLQPAIGANPARLIRSNLMWCLKTLPAQLFDAPSIPGLNFNVKFRGQNLYFGRMDNRNRPRLTLNADNQTATASSKGEQRKRALGEQISNISAVSTNVPGQGNAIVDVDYHFVPGNILPKTGIFSAVLDLIFGLAPHQFSQRVTTAHISDPDPPAWIFVKYNDIPDMTQKLHVYQVIALLQTITQYYVRQQIWQEMVFYLLIDGRVVAGGCVTKADESRKWCNGMELRGVDTMGDGLGGL